MRCKNCEHEIIKHIDSKGNVKYLHYNVYYFNESMPNSKECIECEECERECLNPEPIKKPKLK